MLYKEGTDTVSLCYTTISPHYQVHSNLNILFIITVAAEVYCLASPIAPLTGRSENVPKLHLSCRRPALNVLLRRVSDQVSHKVDVMEFGLKTENNTQIANRFMQCTQSWTRIGCIHGLDWIGLDCSEWMM